MNYIEELLRRQAAVFAALLRGGEETDLTREQADGPADVDGRNEGRELPAGKGMAEWNRRLAERSVRAYGETALAAGMPQTAETTETQAMLRRRAADGAARRKPTAEALESVLTGAEADEVDGWERTGGGLGMLAGAGRTRRKGGNAPIRAGAAPGDGGTEAAAWAGWGRSARAARDASAEELSREFERDARRYDGGYPLY